MLRDCLSDGINQLFERQPFRMTFRGTKRESVSPGGRLGRDRMVVGFTATYAIRVYHHCCCVFESRSGRGVQHYVIKFVCDLRQIGGFLRVLRFLPPIKLTATI